MRIATFNIENLFSRARALNQDTIAEGRVILDEFTKLSKRLEKKNYTAADKQAILDSLTNLGLAKSDDSKFVILRQNRGRLIKRPRNAPPEIVANGRGDWIGWIELKEEAVDEIATRMTAKVVSEIQPDVLAVIEAEDRIALCRFQKQLLAPLAFQFRSIMLVDGNDDRGIDVGLMCKPGFAIEWIASHVDDDELATRPDDRAGTTIFSRDCPEFTIRTPNGNAVLILVNHFKSKGHGTMADSNARRKRQAWRAREIYDQRIAEGIEHIAVVGDFNDTPQSDPLSPLLAEGSDLQDIFDHPQFQGDGRLGTYGNGTASQKIDYLLLSPALWQHVTAAGIFRKGVWGGVNGTLFPHFDEMTKAEHAASDHAALWVDLDV